MACSYFERLKREYEQAKLAEDLTQRILAVLQSPQSQAQALKAAQALADFEAMSVLHVRDCKACLADGIKPFTKATRYVSTGS